MERGAKFVGSSGGVGIASTAKEAEMRIGRGSAKEGEERSGMTIRLRGEAVHENRWKCGGPQPSKRVWRPS